MSASDHLSDKQFRLFHGTNKATIKGGVIQPSKQRGDEWDGNGPEAAFASTNLEDAARYGKHVFEVEPHSSMENYGSGVFASEEGFKVKRKIDPKVVDRYSRTMGPIREQQEQLAHRKWLGENNMVHHSYEGPGREFHVSYDKEGNESKVQVDSFLGCPECNKNK